MASDKLRSQIAWEAARLICYHEESAYVRAKWKAALRVCGSNVRTGDLPSTREIRDQIANLEKSLKRDSFGLPPEQAVRQSASRIDRFRIYEALLLPLEQVKENRKYHPEGDALYHSLQVFALAREELPYDEEFLLAALLHDVGKAIDPKEHLAAGLAALDGSITARTAWLIEHQHEARALYEGKLGVRSRRRLEASEDFHELMLLADCDRKGRVQGAQVPDVVDALQYVRQLAETYGE